MFSCADSLGRVDKLGVALIWPDFRRGHGATVSSNGSWYAPFISAYAGCHCRILVLSTRPSVPGLLREGPFCGLEIGNPGSEPLNRNLDRSRDQESVSRLFVALPLPQELRTALCAMQTEWTGSPALRWTRPETMHMTLHFLGTVENALIRPLAAALSTIASPAFRLSFTHAGTFGRGDRTVLWAGCAPSAELDLLHDRVCAALATVLPDVCANRTARTDRAGRRQRTSPPHWTPHCTLARVRSMPARNESGGRRALQDLVRSLRLPDNLSFAVSSFVLYQSVLSSAGAQHTPLATFELPR